MISNGKEKKDTDLAPAEAEHEDQKKMGEVHWNPDNKKRKESKAPPCLYARMRCVCRSGRSCCISDRADVLKE